MVYVIVGSVSAIIDLLTLRILLGLNTPQWPAVTIAFIAGFVFNLKLPAPLGFMGKKDFDLLSLLPNGNALNSTLTIFKELVGLLVQGQ